ncbi:hypothetical protein OPQ81_010540 [Rhizoctonia solani]|nr:hypothetical protein OPQ81_010540 [Rhizoctonia solani]
MGKKKPAIKRTATTPTVSPATNGGTSDVTTSPTASTFAKESPQDEINETNSTEGNSTGNAATTTADTPAAPMTKSQKKKAAAARKAAAAAALANDKATSQQPATTEGVDTPAEPVEGSEANTDMTKSGSDEPETSKPLEDIRTPEPEKDLEGDAWGLNEDEPAASAVDRDVTKVATDETRAPSAQDGNSADDVQVTAVEPKSEDSSPKDKDVLSGDQATEPVPPPPSGEALSDAVPNSPNRPPSPDASDPPETKNDPVIPSEEVAVEENRPNADTTKPNGTFNCEPMDLPPRPSDDDNTPLAQIAARKKPIVDTSLVYNGLVGSGESKQTPSSAGDNLGSAQSGSHFKTTGNDRFSNSPSRPNAPSTSPSTPGVPARGPGAVGFGSAAPQIQTPTTTPGFGFGLGSPQKPKNASGMSWSPSPASASSKPAAKSSGWGWGNFSGLANKAREAIEQTLNDGPSPVSSPTSGPQPLSARSPSVERPTQSPLVGPANSNSKTNVTPASPVTRPTKGMSALEMRLKKAVTGTNRDSSPGPAAETPKASSSTVPPSDLGASPISPSQSTQSHTQSQPLPLPLPPSTGAPTEQTAPRTPNQAKVTSALSPPPHESTAETGNVGKLIAKFDNTETPISSKTATTGLRLHTGPLVPDGRRSASPVTKRDSIGSETERPSLADMRSSSAPGPRTPITTASPKTPGSLFGPGLGTTGRFNRGGFGFAGGGLAGFRPGHGPGPMSNPVGEKNESKFESRQDLDDLSSVVEGSEPQDLDSQVGESEPQDLDSLVDDSGDALPNLPINIDIDSPAIPTTFNAPVPDVAPSYSNPWDNPPIVTTEALPASNLGLTPPLPSPTRSELEREVAIPDDKTIADPSDLVDVVSESVPQDEPRVESPVASEPAITPVAEKPTVPPAVQEPVVAPVLDDLVVTPIVDEPVVAPVVDESIIKPILHDEVPAPETTEPAAVPEPQFDEPPPELSAEETPELPVEQAVKSSVEPAVEVTAGPTPEPTPEHTPEPHAESIVETPTEIPVEQTPELVVEPVAASPELVAVPSVEPVSEPVVELATIASTLESSTEPSSYPLPTSPIEPPATEPPATEPPATEPPAIEPPAIEPATVVQAEAPAEKPAPPKLTLDLPHVDGSSKPKSPLPPTPATPVTPATPAKKKKKKGKKGNTVVSEPAPVIPETISEPAPQSEPVSKSEPVSMSEPAPRLVPEPGPAEPNVEPESEARAHTVTPTPVEPKVEEIPEPGEPTPTVEVPPTSEASKEPEPTPEVVEDKKPKEEAVLSSKPKKTKQKKKRKSSTAPQVVSPTDDDPPTPVEIEQPEVQVIEVAESVVAEPVVVDSAVAEPAVVKPTEVEPEAIEPEVVVPVPVEPVMVEPVLVEPLMVEAVTTKPVVEVPYAAVEELTKNNDNSTGFETPKVTPQELQELVPEPVETSVQSPIVEPPVEVVVPVAEPVPEPVLVSLSTEAYPEVTPTLEGQTEPEPEPIVEPAVEPTNNLITDAATPLFQVVTEDHLESAHELLHEPLSDPTMEPIAGLMIAPPTEEIIIEVPLVADSAPQLEVEPPTEPVFELAAPPAVEVPKEEVPGPEEKVASPSQSKSARKKNKKKGAGKATVTADEPDPSSVNAGLVVDAVRPEIPIASTVEENKISEEIAAIPSPTTPKKKKGKAKAPSVAPTPIEEKNPTPLPVEAPVPLVETHQQEMEEVSDTIAQVESLRSPIQGEPTPKIEVIELADDQDADAASTISVVQPHLDGVAPVQPMTPVVELAPIELVSEVMLEPESVPVIVQLPESPVTSVPSISSPHSMISSPRPEETVLATRAASPPPRSATPNTDKHEETRDDHPQIPMIAAPSPVRPFLEHVVSAEVTAPPSASPASDSVSQSSRDIGSFGREVSDVPQESQSHRRTGSASSITSIDTDSPSSVEKMKMRPAMPPLISVPIPSPVATASPYLDSAITQPSAQLELEQKAQATIPEGPEPSTVTNDPPTNDVAPKLDTSAKSPSRILDGFSPLRWFGFGGSLSPAIESKPVEVKPVEVKPAGVKPIEVQPVEVNHVEIKVAEVKPVEVKPVEYKPVEVKPVEANPVEVKSVQTKPTEVKPSEVELIESKPVEVQPTEAHPAAVKPVETPVAVPSPVPKAAENREKQPKVPLVPIRKAASPSSPESPVLEKTVWSRWPYQSAMITSIPPVKPRVPLARDSVPIPARSDGQITPSRPGRLPAVSTMPPIIPIPPIAAVSPSTPTKVDPQHSRRSHRANGATLPIPPTPVCTQDAPVNENKERPVKLQPAAVRGTVSTPNIPAGALQSPRSSEDSLPAYTPQAPNVDRDPKPIPRGILKRRITPPTIPPKVETPTSADPARATLQVPKFEFAGSRDVPAYDDWTHASSVRKDTWSNGGVPRSHEAQPPSATTTPPSSRNRTTGDPNHRSRSKHSHKESGSIPNKDNRPRTPSPLREPKVASQATVTPPKPNLVPVLKEKIIRTKAPKPAKISTARTTGNVYIQPLTSPILLTSENYGTRPPENSVYQYDVRISPAEPLSPSTRKAIFDILQKQVAPQVFPVLARPSFDGKKMLYAQRRLNVSSRQEFTVELPEDGQQPRVYMVQLKRIAVITPQVVPAFG